MATDTVPTGPITLAPPPWNTRATMYIIPFWTSRATAKNLPTKAYHPLEAQSSFASPEFGIPKGGLSQIQLIRYHETPVGPYDEMIICPGSFEYPAEDKDGKKTTKTALRITCLYVSQKYTCWNGRKIWNLPKHLAHFSWTDHPNGTTEIKVYPHDHRQPFSTTSTSSNPSSTTKPFFQATIKPIPYLPSVPLSSALLPKLGYDLTLVQPPLPAAADANEDELPGTEEWVAMTDYTESSRKSCLAWGDFAQAQSDGEGGEGGDDSDGIFWPGLGRSGVVVKMEKGEAAFGEGVSWATPRWLL